MKPAPPPPSLPAAWLELSWPGPSVDQLHCCNGWDALPQLLCDCHPHSHHIGCRPSDLNLSNGAVKLNQLQPAATCANQVGPAQGKGGWVDG